MHPATHRTIEAARVVFHHFFRDPGKQKDRRDSDQQAQRNGYAKEHERSSAALCFRQRRRWGVHESATRLFFPVYSAINSSTLLSSAELSLRGYEARFSR